MKKEEITKYAIVGLILLVIYKLWEKRQPKTDESKFFNTGGGNTVSYSLNNPTGSTQTVSLFGRTPNTSAAVSVTGDAKSLQADIQAHPVQVKSIKIISKNQQQVESPIQVSCSSPTGKRSSYYKRPVISPTSFRNDVVEIKPSRLILSGACKINYDMQPNSQANVTLTLGKSLGGAFDGVFEKKPRVARRREALQEMKIIQ